MKLRGSNVPRRTDDQKRPMTASEFLEKENERIDLMRRAGEFLLKHVQENEKKRQAEIEALAGRPRRRHLTVVK